MSKKMRRAVAGLGSAIGILGLVGVAIFGGNWLEDKTGVDIDGGRPSLVADAARALTSDGPPSDEQLLDACVSSSLETLGSLVSVYPAADVERLRSEGPEICKEIVETANDDRCTAESTMDNFVAGERLFGFEIDGNAQPVEESFRCQVR